MMVLGKDGQAVQRLAYWSCFRNLAQCLGSRIVKILGLLGLIIILVALPGAILPGKLIPEAMAKETGNTDSEMLNSDLNSTNIMYLWTERDRLKVITVMAINHDSKKAGIATIPLSSYFPGEPARLTIEEIFQKEGKKGLVTRLERYLGTPIQHQVEVEQQALKKMSDILGNFEVNGDTLDMAQAFHETSTARRFDDQDVVRAIACKLIRPEFWIKVPQLVWVMVRDVQTDLSGKDIWRLFREFQGTNVGGLRKTALPGREYVEGGKRYREVPVGEWSRILVQLTGQG